MAEKEKTAKTAKAVGRHLRTSPYKLNQIAKMIRGKKADIALNDLQFLSKKMAGTGL